MAPSIPLAPPKLSIEVRPSDGKGRGVFATERIPEGSVIERCPVIVVPAREIPALTQTTLVDYFFRWGPFGDDGAIALGFGSLYNHAAVPNAIYVRHRDEGVLEFLSVREIAPDEEITVSYHGGFGDHAPMPFEPSSSRPR